MLSTILFYHSEQAKLDAKKEKRTRGSRNALPQNLYVAGEFLPIREDKDEEVNEETFANNNDFTVVVEENSPNTSSASRKEIANAFGNLSSPGQKRLAALLERRSDYVNSDYTPRYGVHTYSMNKVRSGTADYVTPEVQYDGHSDPITCLSYGPYNNGPLTSMCEGGLIKVWGNGNGVKESRNSPVNPENETLLIGCGSSRSSSRNSNSNSRSNSRNSHGNGGSRSSSQNSNMMIIEQEPTDVLRYGTPGRPISIYASAVQPNDHIWTAGVGHLKAWPLA